MSLSITLSLSGPVGYLLPVTSMLGPRRVKVVSISCRIHLLHCTLTDSILLSLKSFDKTKKMKRRQRREAEKEKELKRTGRYREMEQDRREGKKRRDEKELAGTVWPVS